MEYSMTNRQNQTLLTDLNRVLETFEAEDELCTDVYTTMRRLELINSYASEKMLHVYDEGGCKNPCKVSDWAFGQLTAKLDIPTGYTMKLWTQGHEIAVKDLVNYFIDASPYESKKLLVRMKGVHEGMDKIRAILSDKYSILNNSTIVKHLLSLLQFNSNAELQVCNYNDQYMHLRLLFTPVDCTEDEFRVGVDIINSEVGAANLTISSLVWRLVCSNGLRAMVPEAVYRQRHIYLKPLQIVDYMSDAINECLMSAEKLSRDFLKARLVPIKHPAWMMSNIIEDNAIQDQHTNIILTEFVSVKVSSLYDIINVLTAAAKSLPFEDRLKLESLAGSLVYLSGPAINKLQEVRAQDE